MPNSHPVFVHIPLVLWPLAALAWGVGLARKKDELLVAGRWLAHLALASALVTVVTGLRAEDSLGHDSPHHELVHVHKYFMLSTTALGAIASVLAHVVRKRADVKSRAAVSAALIVTVVVMTLGADRGALLVYRHGLGTHAPTGGQVEPAEGEDWPAHGPQDPEGSTEKGAPMPSGSAGTAGHSH